MKKILMLFTILIMLFSLSFAAHTFINPLGPTLLPIAELFTDKGVSAGGFEIEFWRSMDQAIANIVSKEVDAALLPVTVGAQLAAKGVPIKLAAVSMWDGFYFVSKEKIDNVMDLEGKTVYTLQAPGQTADVILKGLLEKRNISSVNIVYVAGPESVQLFAAGKAEILLLPEPFASLAVTKVPEAVKSLPIEKMWNELTGKDFSVPTSGIFVRANLETTVADSFLLLYSQSLEMSLQNLDKSATFVSEKMGGFPVPVLKKAFLSTKYEFKADSEMRKTVTQYIKGISEIDDTLIGNVNFDEFFYESEVF
ncbi:MAG: ABC transporter substrate-binding protein [Kosmotoga sp.]|nr:MAG: ABC transporter substrate-binding protein [Kosmotoga sp.]